MTLPWAGENTQVITQTVDPCDERSLATSLTRELLGPNVRHPHLDGTQTPRLRVAHGVWKR